MASPPQNLLTVSAILLLLLISTTADPPPSDAEKKAAADAANAPPDCQKCDFPELCIPLLEDKKIATQLDLVEAAAEYTKAALKEAMGTTDQLTSISTSEEEKANLAECKKSYQEAINGLDKTMQEVKDPNVTGMQIDAGFSKSNSLYMSCKDKWLSTDVKIFCLGDAHNKIRNMFLNVLMLARGLGLPPKPK